MTEATQIPEKETEEEAAAVDEAVTVDNTMHPAYGLAKVSYIKNSQPQSMFLSDTRPTTYVELSISQAQLSSIMNREYARTTEEIVKVRMTPAQWAQLAFETSNGHGTPVTIERRGGTKVEPLPCVSRLNESHDHIATEIQELLTEVRENFDKLNDLEEAKAGIKLRRAARHDLDITLQNLPANAKYLITSLQETADKIVEEARIEAKLLTSMENPDNY